jgi:hypothetical protein
VCVVWCGWLGDECGVVWGDQQWTRRKLTGRTPSEYSTNLRPSVCPRIIFTGYRSLFFTGSNTTNALRNAHSRSHNRATATHDAYPFESVDQRTKERNFSSLEVNMGNKHSSVTAERLLAARESHADVISLDHCDLHVIPPELFSGIWGIRRLLLSNNALTGMLFVSRAVVCRSLVFCFRGSSLSPFVSARHVHLLTTNEQATHAHIPTCSAHTHTYMHVHTHTYIHRYQHVHT